MHKKRITLHKDELKLESPLGLKSILDLQSPGLYLLSLTLM